MGVLTHRPPLQDSKQHVSDRNVQLVLMKKTEGPYWPRLLRDGAKVHWLKVDFGKWKDEDDSEDEGDAASNMDLEAVSGPSERRVAVA